jgi:hypothetical protein
LTASLRFSHSSFLTRSSLVDQLRRTLETYLAHFTTMQSRLSSTSLQSMASTVCEHSHGGSSKVELPLKNDDATSDDSEVPAPAAPQTDPSTLERYAFGCKYSEELRIGQKLNLSVWDPEMGVCRRIAAKKLLATTLITIIVMWLCLPFYWGSREYPSPIQSL